MARRRPAPAVEPEPAAVPTLDALLAGRSDRSIGNRRRLLRKVRAGHWPRSDAWWRLCADLGVDSRTLHAAITATHAEHRRRQGGT